MEASGIGFLQKKILQCALFNILFRGKQQSMLERMKGGI
jgi:hypothetical protein